MKYEQFNSQEQPHTVWPPSFALARAYVDQLERTKGLSAGRLAAVRLALANAEKLTGVARRSRLNELATSLDVDASRSVDAAKGRTLAQSVRGLGR